MKILSLTTLWPNPMQPFLGLFNRERVRTLADYCDVRVVAPVAWIMSVHFLARYYGRRYTPIPWHEHQGTLGILHPRFAVVPKVCKFSDGWLLYQSLRKPIQRLRREFPFELLDAYYAYPDGYAAGCLAQELGIPYTVSVLGTDVLVFGRERFRGALIRQSLRKASRIFCVAESLKREAMDIFGLPEEQIVVIENGVDCQKFHPLPQADARTRLQLDQEAQIVLSIGHLRELKGFHLLIDALHDLNQTQRSAREAAKRPLQLVIVGGEFVGEPDYKARLERQIADYGLQAAVLLAGPRPPEELKYWYAAADVFCLASSREGCPNVVLESLACGKPIVATAVGEIPRLVPTQEFGLLVERTAESLGQGMMTALERVWQTDAIVEHARQFSWERTSAKMYHIFEEILA